jgi:butyrate response factor 1
MSTESYTPSQQFAELDYKSGALMWFANLDTNSPWGSSFQLPIPPQSKKEVGVLDSKLTKPKIPQQSFSNDFVQVSSNQRWNSQNIGFTQNQSEPKKVISKIPQVISPLEAVNCDAALEEETSQNLYKTELCRSFEETGICRYGTKCQFAHGRAELRHVSRHPKYKTEVCKTFHTIGTCPYGKRCRFIHIEGPHVPPQSSPVKPSTPVQSEIKAAVVKPPVFETAITNGSLVSNGWSGNWSGVFPSTATVNLNPAVKGLPPKLPAANFPPLNASVEFQERSRLGIFQQICS